MTSHELVCLRLYDVLGRECGTLLNGEMGPGEFDVPLNASSLKDCGMYVYQLEAGGVCQQRTMQIMR